MSAADFPRGRKPGERVSFERVVTLAALAAASGFIFAIIMT